MTHAEHEHQGKCSRYEIDTIEEDEERNIAGLHTIWHKTYVTCQSQ
jgi:hypothetical protein